MRNRINDALADTVRGLHLPRYNEIPDVGLYLDQTAKYINACIARLGLPELTGAMIRNYVKQDMVANPVNKRYYADQIAHLIAIAVLKQGTPLEHINRMFLRQQKIYPVPVAYDYFCAELENILYFRFGVRDTVEDIGVTSTIEKEMLRSAIIAVSHLVYLNTCFKILEEE